MVKKATKKGLDGLNKLDLEAFETLWENIQQAWDEKQYGVVVGNLVILAEKFGEVSPELAPAMGLIIDSYGSAAKPFFDQFFDEGTKATGYFVEQIAEAKKTLLPQFEKHEEVKATIYAMKLRVLKNAKFTRREAMEIILSEISKGGGLRNSLAGNSPKINLSSPGSSRRTLR